MKRRLLLAAGLLAACHTLPPEVLPPPWGPVHAQDTHLFFPSGLAVTADGALLVANGNFNHAYDGGTVVGLSPDFIAGFFARKLHCDVPAGAAAGACDQPIPPQAPAVIIGNYAGPLVLDAAGTTAYTGSRDTGVLNAVSVGVGGAVSCAPGSGSGTDCRGGLVDLKTAASLDGPFTIVRGDFIPQGQTAAHPVLFVNSLVPHIESISSGVINTSSAVAALEMGNPAQVLFTMPVATPFVANGWAVGPMVFDGVRRRLYLGGCYERFPGTGAGEPGSGKCAGVTNNYLRIIDVDAQGNAQPTLYDLYDDVLSIEITQLALADPDPTTGAPTTLWATMRNPDALVQIELPVQPAISPRVRRVVPMPISPADMLIIPRPGASALIVVAAEKSGAVAIYDTGLRAVVAVVEHLGLYPFSLAQVPCPASAGSACVAATVFGECKLAFIEVPLAAPWTAELRGRAGGCP